MRRSEKIQQLEQAQGWFYDRYLSREVEAQRYLYLSMLLGLLLSLSLIAWIILLPLKRTVTEPYIMLIDNIAGTTATLTAAKTEDVFAHSTVVRYFLAKYVQAREGYHTTTLEQQIDLVRAFSSPEAFMTFQREWEEPLRQEQRQALHTQDEVTAEILSVTFPLSDVAHVRYKLNIRRAGHLTQANTWLATLKISQAQEIDNQLAILNPLGLVVTHYTTVMESNYELSTQNDIVSNNIEHSY